MSPSASLDPTYMDLGREDINNVSEDMKQRLPAALRTLPRTLRHLLRQLNTQ